MKDRSQQLLSMIKRLQEGEDLETVRQDFVDQFQSVSVHEIIDAEKALLDSGTPMEEVQSLCDLHSALFHGKTEAEVYMEEERAMTPYLIQILKDENIELLKRIRDLKKLLQTNADPKAVEEALTDLKTLKVHYAKKEELIMPYLYDIGIEGPSQVMWGVDDDILKTLSALIKTKTFDAGQVNMLLDRMKEMVFKEEQILFPMAKEKLDPQVWLETYGDIAEFGYAWLAHVGPWPKGEEWEKEHVWKPEDVDVCLPTGTVKLSTLAAMFEALPIDLTWIDADDRFRFFTNEGKIFSRPKSALGRKVYGCHPPQLIPVVKEMLEGFKAKKNDRVERWIPNPAKPVKVVYQALYDKDGKYIGTLEMVQSFENEMGTLKAFAKNK